MKLNARWSCAMAVPLVVCVTLSACTTLEGQTYAASDFATVRKIDAHVHVNVADDAFLDQAAADNFEILSINVDYPAFPSISDQAEVAHHFAERNLERFHYATTFSMDGFGQAGWAERANSRIDADVMGMALPRSVIDKIYSANARRVFFSRPDR